MDNTINCWSVPVTVEELPEAGRHIAIEAPAEVRGAIAKLASLRDLPRLSASFDLTRQGAGVHVVGTVSATVGQTCVVSLEPMQSEIEEPVDIIFAPPPVGSAGDAGEAPVKRGKSAGKAAVKSPAKPADEFEVSLAVKPGEDPPEPLVGGIVDLGALATEFLLLGIDPYPRKAGAEFAPPKVEDGEAHPFAALEALKKPPGSDRS